MTGILISQVDAKRGEATGEASEEKKDRYRIFFMKSLKIMLALLHGMAKAEITTSTTEHNISYPLDT